jgi:SOS-response transcriptional repressor LexA
LLYFCTKVGLGFRDRSSKSYPLYHRTRSLISSSVILCVILVNELECDAEEQLFSESENLICFALLIPGLTTARMADNSMKPLIEKGDIVIADKNLPFKTGKIYILSIFHKHRCIRTVKKVKGGYRLTPANSAFSEKTVPKKEVRTLSRVIRVLSHDGDGDHRIS